jgi:DNA-binding transcriptional LysR family regulator
MKKLDLDVIEMVVAVAEAKSFVRGARVVHRSPSAVSMQIKTLEDALGKPLFKRNTRHVEITAEGMALLDYGRRMLNLRQEAWAAIVRPEVTGRIVLGVPDDFAPPCCPPPCAGFTGPSTGGNSCHRQAQQRADSAAGRLHAGLGLHHQNISGSGIVSNPLSGPARPRGQYGRNARCRLPCSSMAALPVGMRFPPCSSKAFRFACRMKAPA